VSLWSDERGNGVEYQKHGDFIETGSVLAAYTAFRYYFVLNGATNITATAHEGSLVINFVRNGKSEIFLIPVRRLTRTLFS